MISLMILLAAVVYLVIGSFIIKRIQNKWGKGIVIAILILIPTWDSIVGHIYLNHLCSTEAGVRIYQTVELPAEYWDSQGKMRFLKSNGDIDQVMLGKKFEWHSVNEPYSVLLVKVDKVHWQFRDAGTQRVLAERTSFWWLGGWLGEFSPAPTRGASCPLLSEQYSGNEYKRRVYAQEQNFYSKIFRPINSQ